MTAPRTQMARRTRIAEILTMRDVHSQGELREILAAEGFSVTQATVSRDLVDLGAAKRIVDGRAVYSLAPDGAVEAGSEMGRLGRAIHELVVAVDSSANIVVIRTPPGGAQYLASSIDRSLWPSVLGTVAGDDTVFLVTRDSAGGVQVAAEILGMAEGRQGAEG